MKVRGGFVSNSSSTSFIVSVPNTDTECGICHKSNKWMLQAVGQYIANMSDKTHKLYAMTSGEEVERYFSNELTEHLNSKKYFEEQLVIIAELEANPKVYEDYMRLHKQLDRSSYTLKQEADMSKYKSHETTLVERKQRIQNHLDGHDKKAEQLKSLIRKVKKAIRTDCTIYAFNIDNWATDADQALKRMITDGVIELIWKEST